MGMETTGSLLLFPNSRVTGYVLHREAIVWVEPKGEEDCATPKTPVEFPPKRELPVLDPKGVVPPKGLCANGLLLVCPKPDCEPNGLVDDRPKAVALTKNQSVHQALPAIFFCKMDLRLLVVTPFEKSVSELWNMDK